MNKTYSYCSQPRGGAFHLTQKVDYALFLLSLLARNKNEITPSLQILSKKYSMSFSFLQKVAGLLKQNGFITGIRGKRGGYLLNRAPQSLSLKEIIEAVDGPITVRGCLSHDAIKTVCPREQFCSVKSHLATMNEKIVMSYSNKKLSDIAKL